MADELYGTFGNVQYVSGVKYQTMPHDEEYFLRKVVTPIYEVLHEVTRMFFCFFFLWIFTYIIT